MLSDDIFERPANHPNWKDFALLTALLLFSRFAAPPILRAFARVSEPLIKTAIIDIYRLSHPDATFLEIHIGEHVIKISGH